MPNQLRVPTLVLIALLTAASSLRAEDEPKPIPLWPSDAPGEKGDIGPERDTSKPGEGLVAGKPIIRIGNVAKPTITLYRPPPDKDTGAAVVVCPGGAYSILAYDL